MTQDTNKTKYLNRGTTVIRPTQQLVLFYFPHRSPQLTMSDSDGDIDDELLELAGATEKKRKRQVSGSKQSGNKKRKARHVLAQA